MHEPRCAELGGSEPETTWRRCRNGSTVHLKGDTWQWDLFTHRSAEVLREQGCAVRQAGLGAGSVAPVVAQLLRQGREPGALSRGQDPPSLLKPDYLEQARTFAVGLADRLLDTIESPAKPKRVNAAARSN